MRPGITNAMKPKTFLNEANPKIRGRNNNSFNLKSFRIMRSGMNNFFSFVLAGNKKERFLVITLVTF